MKTPAEWIETVGESGVRQAIGELRAFASSLRNRGMEITASQLECVCDFTTAYLDEEAAAS